MIRRWLKDDFQLSKKNYSDDFGNEPWLEAGTFKGFIQPITGRLSNTSGKDSGEAAYMLYCEVSAEVDAGDRITDKHSRVWIAQFVQQDGISGTGDHQEITCELVR